MKIGGEHARLKRIAFDQLLVDGIELETFLENQRWQNVTRAVPDASGGVRLLVDGIEDASGGVRRFGFEPSKTLLGICVVVGWLISLLGPAAVLLGDVRGLILAGIAIVVGLSFIVGSQIGLAIIKIAENTTELLDAKKREDFERAKAIQKG